MTMHANCSTCAYLMPGTLAGSPVVTCTNSRNTNKLSSAPVCRVVGWHETETEARARKVRESMERQKQMLRQIESRAGLALGMGRRALRGRG